MNLQSDLTNDRERGPGHGLLRLSGGGLPPGPMELSLMRNQGTSPYLGHGGQWQATVVWHLAEATTTEGDSLSVRLGPDLVDPIVALPPTVAFRLGLRVGDLKQEATLRIAPSLLGTNAGAVTRPSPDAALPKAPEPPVPIAPTPSALDGPPELATAPPEEPAPPAPEPRPRWIGLLGIVALLALVAGGLFAYFNCLIPPFGPAQCAASKPVTQENPGTTAPPQAPAPTPEPAPAPPRPDNCAKLGAEDCLALADGALQGKQTERARQLFQEAARLGAVAANLRLAQMYDPEGWSAERSPVSTPDWETAAYWYEEAARAQDPAGLQGAGRLLCRHGKTDFERSRGLGFLREAAAKGAEVRTLINDCGGKP